MKKKFFSLTAAVAVLSMLMTSVTVASCSDDDDDDTTEQETGYKTVTSVVNLGGSESSKGSFLCFDANGNATSKLTKDVNTDASDVYIVFNGTEFNSASASANSNVKGNGNSAAISEAAGVYTFSLSGGKAAGLKGTFTVVGDLSGAAAEVVVTVASLVKE